MYSWIKKTNKIIVFLAMIYLLLLFSKTVITADLSLAVRTDGTFNTPDYSAKEDGIQLDKQAIKLVNKIKKVNSSAREESRSMLLQNGNKSAILVFQKAVKEEDEEGFVSLFNGKDLSGWTGDTTSYVAENGKIVVYPRRGSGGNLYTEKEYSNFILRFEFKLTPGANNGLGIRAPLSGDAAYVGMELQILDNTDDRYKDLRPYQFHGSIYGVVPAKRGYLKPVGEWNFEEVIADGRQITVKLNGVTIVDADIDKASTPKTMDGKQHPGLKRDKGHIGFLGHGSNLEFRNIRIKELK